MIKLMALSLLLCGSIALKAQETCCPDGQPPGKHPCTKADTCDRSIANKVCCEGELVSTDKECCEKKQKKLYDNCVALKQSKKDADTYEAELKFKNAKQLCLDARESADAASAAALQATKNKTAKPNETEQDKKIRETFINDAFDNFNIANKLAQSLFLGCISGAEIGNSSNLSKIDKEFEKDKEKCHYDFSPAWNC